MALSLADLLKPNFLKRSFSVGTTCPYFKFAGRSCPLGLLGANNVSLVVSLQLTISRVINNRLNYLKTNKISKQEGKELRKILGGGGHAPAHAPAHAHAPFSLAISIFIKKSTQLVYNHRN